MSNSSYSILDYYTFIYTKRTEAKIKFDDQYIKHILPSILGCQNEPIRAYHSML